MAGQCGVPPGQAIAVPVRSDLDADHVVGPGRKLASQRAVAERDALALCRHNAVLCLGGVGRAEVVSRRS